MAKKKQQWKEGDIFVLPLEDGEFGLGQVISFEKHCMDSVLCAYFSTTIKSLDESFSVPQERELVSVQITTRDLLDAGVWRVIHNSSPINVEHLFPIKELREAAYIGAKIKGSAIMVGLLNAFHGFTYWDDFYDPEYLDKLLIAGVKRPRNVKLNNS